MEHDIHLGRGALGEYHVPWIDQSLYSPHGVINYMLFYKSIRKQNFLLYTFLSSILIRQERNTDCVCFI